MDRSAQCAARQAIHEMWANRPSILESYEIGSAYAVLARYFFLAGSRKRVEMRDDFSALETGVGQGREIACRLQSTRDSANPEFDIVERRL